VLFSQEDVRLSHHPYALLDALLLRFALSEHFLNVDELLSQLRDGSAPDVKKKQPINPSTAPGTGIKAETKDEGRGTIEDRRQTTDDRGQTTDDRAGMNNTQRGKTISRRKNEIINDPAVKTILIGLDATITGIEEEQQDG